MKNSIIKKSIIGALLAALVIAIAVGSSLAFLTDKAEKTNTFTVGKNLDITLDENNWNPDKGLDLQPGHTTTKDPLVTAVQNNSYMRVKVTYIDKNGDAVSNQNYGKEITDATRIAQIKKTIYFDQAFNHENATGTIDVAKKYSSSQLAAITEINNGVNPLFTLDASRNSNVAVEYYNYNTIFNETDKKLLFTHVVVPSDWGYTQIELLGKYDIVIQAQAIQTTGFANADEAFTALDAEITAAP